MVANLQVQDSLTAKIKTMKISGTQILARFAKICTHENYQPYSTSFKIVQNSLENLVLYYVYNVLFISVGLDSKLLMLTTYIHR